MNELKPIGPDGKPIVAPKLPATHSFLAAKDRHAQAGEIISALIEIEAFRLDALDRMKKATPESEEHTAAASALAVLSAKRKQARANYAAYFKDVLNLIK